MAANPNDRNWKGIIIALACIVLILASVAVSVVILTPPEEVSLLYEFKFIQNLIFEPQVFTFGLKFRQFQNEFMRPSFSVILP